MLLKADAFGIEAWYVFNGAGVVEIEEELCHAKPKPTDCRIKGGSTAGGIASLGSGGITRSPSSEVGENERLLG